MKRGLVAFGGVRPADHQATSRLGLSPRPRKALRLDSLNSLQWIYSTTTDAVLSAEARVCTFRDGSGYQSRSDRRLK